MKPRTGNARLRKTGSADGWNRLPNTPAQANSLAGSADPTGAAPKVPSTAIVSESGALVLYDAACRALAEAHSIDEVKSIRDKMVALQHWARQAKNSTMIVQATEIRMRAERNAGELLVKMAERGERQKPGDDPRGVNSRGAQPLKPKLADLGINKTQSSRWQALAELDPASFETKVTHASLLQSDRIAHKLIREDKVRRRRQERDRIVAQDGCTVEDLGALAESGYRAAVIYADPGWEFRAFSREGRMRSGDAYYRTDDVEKIKALPVAPLAGKDCALLLWATWPNLLDALAVIEAWGFTYKTVAFVWVKTTKKAECIELDGRGLHRGMGLSATQANTEFCLFATKGSPLRLAADVPEIIVGPVGERHSEKPGEVRRRIEQLFGEPYLELYARKLTPRWRAWGDEIRRADFPPYDPLDDINKSVAEGFAAVKERMAAGGPGWPRDDGGAR